MGGCVAGARFADGVCSRATPQVVPYAELLDQLKIDTVRELEVRFGEGRDGGQKSRNSPNYLPTPQDLIIDAIYKKLVGGKLDQVRHHVSGACVLRSWPCV